MLCACIKSSAYFVNPPLRHGGKPHGGKLLKGRGAMAGLRTALTTYTGRHTWASAMRDMGTSLSVISKGLGHENLKTTQIYLSSIDTEDLVKANRKMIGKIMRE
ncbi:tyrosine-type recombinase/integrase [Bacteroides sp. An19]|uniref:tyrosine-type recombinase/integrase n=1 Tax=Bacteroides sp. An19 TaxID=1965580 RepID=UPI001F14C156|nr:tyrosine-type recombinase/integrase [Bacteroides sp. An19]